MNKVSLLAASVAIALTGCGGSDGGSNGGNSGVVITGFDGYFKNAVVFEDLNNNGQWDTNDTFLGLTDEKGQLKIKAKPESTLALQTITPNGAKQKQLIALDPTYAGTYTVDMDHPSQAMAHELVFRAPNSSNVISPITDLVAIEMANDSALTEEEAVAKVNQALGGTEEAPIDLYSDFVSGVDKSAELHKTAQILTESKAQNPANYEKKATEFAQAADQEVDRLVESGADINDPNLRPVITDSTPESENLAPETVVNNKLVVNEDVEEAAEEKLDNLPEIVKGASFDGVELNIEGLFKDKDQNLVTPKLSHNLDGTGIEVRIEGNQLVLSPAAEVTKAGEFEIILTAEDKDSAGKTLATVSTVFELDIETANQAPIVIEEEQKRLQTIVDGWQLQQGEAFEQTLDISGLFKDEDGQLEEYTAESISIDGLSIDENDNAIITIEGTPEKAYAAGQTFTVNVEDNEDGKAHVTFKLPEVKEGATPPPVVPTLGFTIDHFNGKAAKMGSFARNDGEIGHAILMKDTEGLLWCWGSNDDEQGEEYSANISDNLSNSWESEYDPYAILAKLDKLPNYAAYQNKDCWDVEIKDGKLYDDEGSEYEMLYQNKTTQGEYQILVKIDGDELFWFDSTNAPFAQALPVSEKVANGKVEFDMTVESETVAQDETELFYAAGKFEYANGVYEYESIKPEGFYTPGNWTISLDSETNRETLILEETGSESDYKTRHRNVNREFGDFYIGINSSVEQNGWVSAPEFGLYSHSQEAIEKVMESLPLIED
ncbi:acid phosphatase [Vibrio campbellii]|uniref:acid phosphatase n=1 Tax=Vibrio campbellii TaxID=680 RepID=UPI00142E1F98|nr:acid phosphatase [Vibrio campbellii]NIY86845.1 acid phosphatase [Vibrio campbellii]NVK69602.1 acid phosphatase [Vibrio campbellii]